MYSYEEFGNQSEDRAELEKQGNQVKKDMECQDEMAFPSSRRNGVSKGKPNTS